MLTEFAGGGCSSKLILGLHVTWQELLVIVTLFYFNETVVYKSLSNHVTSA
jgi:hypothetical protein